jgi:RNase P subunit RPR2
MMDFHSKLNHLWNAAKETQLNHPALSRFYCQTILRIVNTNRSTIQISNAFYRNVCSSCGNILLPGATAVQTIKKVLKTVRSQNLNVQDPLKLNIHPKVRSKRPKKNHKSMTPIIKTDSNSRIIPRVESGISLCSECLICGQSALFNIEAGSSDGLLESSGISDKGLGSSFLNSNMQSKSNNSSVKKFNDSRLAQLQRALQKSSSSGLGSFLGSLQN